MLSSLRPITQRVLDLILPPLCLGCDTPVAENLTLCPTCWGKLHFITAPFCDSCGMPFDIPVDAGTQCGACLTDPPPFTKARAAVTYNDTSRAIILAYKHGDQSNMTPTLAGWMTRAGGNILAETDIIIPVPLHRWRLLQRRYNQAALLAHDIAQRTDKTLLVDALLRQRATPTQGHRSRKERAENVKGAFRINPAHTETLRGKNILLIDDVYTTGATLRECSQTLLDAGAYSVRVLTFARVRGAD